MNESDYKIVRITNISDFDFTGELGARYGGRDFFVPAGGSMLTPLTVGEHLATHLARQIIIRKSPIRDANQTDGKGTDRPLWDEAVIADIKSKIMTEVYEEEKKQPQSEAERLALKVEELNKAVKVEPEEISDETEIEPAEIATGSVYRDKAEVISELKRRGIAHDPRIEKSKLELLLQQ